MSAQKPLDTTIAMWSGPRNVSTAVMYAFAQRDDMSVIDEPLYGYYLKASGAQHPGRDVVLDAMAHDANEIIGRLLETNGAHMTFAKMMAHHLAGLDWSFLQSTRNFLLTRAPEEVLPTLSVQLGLPTLEDTGYSEQVSLVRAELAAGRDPLVLDSRQLLTDPESVLRRCCERLQIPWDERMLCWEPGPKPYDGVWAPFWYHNVHKSTGFAPYRPKTTPVADEFKPLLDQCRPLYEEISQYAIHA